MILTAHTSLISSLTQFRSLVRACARNSSLDTGKKLHATLIVTGLISLPNLFLRNALLQLYSACGHVSYARKVFDEIPHSHKDSIDWTTLIGCCARHGVPQKALSFFVDMRKNGKVVDEVAAVCVFNACARLADVNFGLQGHAGIVKSGLYNMIKVCNSVTDLYVKCGLLGEAKRVFEEMKEHSVVSWTVVLEGVVKLEGVENGREVFDRMPEKNEVAWTIMIVGYVEKGFTCDAFSLLNVMVFDYGFQLNYVTLSSLLSACSLSGDVGLGRWVHTYAVKLMGREDMNVMVGTSLVDMYAKCGRMSTALKVFEYMPRRNVVAWNAMLGGLAMHGQGKLVVNMFPCMVKEVKPDAMTFMSLLSACSHSGLVEQGWQYFHSLESVYSIKPEIGHYACMVDLLGRTGHLEEAFGFMKKMPIPPNEVVLGSLLGSCHVHGKLKLGEQMMKELVQMDPHNTEYHILLSSMYALSGKQDKAESLRQVLQKRGIKKIPGMSSIYVHGKLHQFSAGDKSHLRTDEIYIMLDEMIRRLRLAGYVPNTSLQVLPGYSGRDDDECREELEQVLFTHSEKLALCFGLISTPYGSTLYIFKNLRICLDCHSAIKIASDIYKREIVVRDRYRFHSFKQGSCSCSDYW